MSWFYRMLLAWNELDQRIARSTGRNPSHIAKLEAEQYQWEKCLFDCEVTW